MTRSLSVPRIDGKSSLKIHFDDTNPAKKNNEFAYNTLNDLKTMGINYEITFTSDYSPQLIGITQKLIEEGKAFIDDTPRAQMQSERMAEIDFKCRNNTVAENIKLWNEMLAGSDRGLQCCLREKVDMQHPNKSLREPVYYRCNLTPHHRIGPKYKIYPTYDFACPFVDYIQANGSFYGSLRTKWLMDGMMPVFGLCKEWYAEV
uniref:Glutamate--tRNA ligase, cytoplasmic n=1 Tax=Tanacetum cinerariifolium TaxID=118510 RepID=A0A699HGU4_TANCI|nr:glutamate--tRNA ligase, cytoplasmic [Tanacetum cinerariifolium]